MTATVVALSSCSKLGKLSSDNFAVTPTPLEVVGGQVPATINGTFPVKYMKKKAVVTVTPVLKYQGGEAEGQSVTFQGEKVEGNATTIQYKVGGTYTMKTNFAYTNLIEHFLAGLVAAYFAYDFAVVFQGHKRHLSPALASMFSLLFSVFISVAK